MPNKNLHEAKIAKNDEFYTQYEDIQKEVNAYIDYNPDVFRDKTILLPCDDPDYSNFTKFFAQNFERFGIKKLISTSYALESKLYKEQIQLSLLEVNSNKFDKNKTNIKGKIFTLTKADNNKKTDIDNLEWEYLEGDGDFRSNEVKKLRDESDIIITNPPFSLFREFVDWIMEAEKDFLIIGNVNAITYKEIFKLIKDNKLWLEKSIHSGDREFRVPNEYPLKASSYRIDENGNKFIRVKGVRWFTNLEHGRRHEQLSLMTMEDNIRYSKHKEIKNIGYQKYDNYDAIDVPYVDAIPDDYTGVMGVPITFLDKYNPEQFEIIALGITGSCNFTKNVKMEILDKQGNPSGNYTFNAKGTLYKVYNPNNIKDKKSFRNVENGTIYSSVYARILIKKRIKL